MGASNRVDAQRQRIDRIRVVQHVHREVVPHCIGQSSVVVAARCFAPGTEFTARTSCPPVPRRPKQRKLWH